MKLIFDIGANKGDTVDYFIKHADKVVCFEPNLDLFKFLKDRFIKQNVIVDSRGLSDTIGIKKFMIANADTISTFSEEWVTNSRFTNFYKWNKSIDVETTTLDSIINQYGVPEFIKIDVEGHEYEVLQGLTYLLDQTIFGFEWSEEQYENLQESVKHLQKLGYSQFGFTYGDNPCLGENIEYKSWDELEIHLDINPSRQKKWGMIYFKK